MSEHIGIKVNDTVYDLQTATAQNITGEPIYLDNSPDALSIIRHSTAHLMAQAIKGMYSNAKFFVGPVVNEGFYYDFKVDEEIGEEDLVAIEKKMKELAKKNAPITKYYVSKEEALAKYKNDELKTHVLSRIPDEQVSFYEQGDFEDLCRGPHVPKTKLLMNFKLTKISGAYLGGDESKEMLTRVYGIAFADKEALNDHLTFLEEVKKRDHRKIGNDLKLWKFAEEIGGGLPLWLPAGSRLRGKLEKILYSAHRRRGYEPLRGPEMLRSDLWRVSGHIQNYGENMYFTTIDEHEYGIKPMNCVGHIKAYESDLRSYKELPIRYFEFGTVHRHEQSGALHGLLRVREFTQDDAHIFCTDDQIQSEIHDIMEFVQTLMGALGFEYTIYVSTKPDKAIGDDAFWLKATDAIMTALDEKSLPYQIDEGGGAFYGPKIDIKVLDALKREWQCGTIQVDLNLPERFELEYTAADNTKKRPVMLHRAILGSFERFIAIMTEHFSGEFPFYLAPVQVVIIPIGDSHFDYAKEVQKLLNTHEIDADVYAKNESLNKRVRQAEMQKVPMIVVIGDEEVASRTLALRDRRRRERSNIALDDFLNFVKDENGANL